MVKPKYRIFILCIFVFIIIGIGSASAQKVAVQYFHMPGCQDCAKTDPIIESVENNYSINPNGSVTFEWIDASTQDGLGQWQKYGFTEVPAVVINNEIKISKENITEKNLNTTINAYLDDKVDLSNNSLEIDWNIPFAFSMGVFSGFSPCLMAILGFILTYTAGTSRGMKDGMTRAMVFGLGLVTAYVLLGICILAFGKSLLGIGTLSIIAGAVTISIGLNMLGIFKLPVRLDDHVKNSAKKYVGTWSGLFFLGILFSMVKVPCAAPFLLVLINEMITMATINSILLLLTFALGVLTPFLAIGLVGGYALSERVRSYRAYIKAISGIVMILLGILIMI